MSPRPRLTERETEEHARELVEATFRVAADTGDAQPPVRAILREAGLSRQALYRCFGSKDELMAAVLVQGRRLLAGYLAARMARAATPEDKVRAWITGLMRQAQAATERTRPFIVTPPDPATDHQAATERELSAILAGAIADGVAEGTFASPDPLATALLIHDFVFASMRRHLVRDESPTRDAIQQLCDFAARGLSNCGAAARTSPSRRNRRRH